MSAKTAFELRRHYGELSAKDTEEVISAVADLIVDYVKQRGALMRSPPLRAGEVNAEQLASIAGQPADE